MTDQRTLEPLKHATSGEIVDALRMVGVEGGITGIHPVRGFEDAKVVGYASTATYGPTQPGTSSMTMYSVIRETRPDRVLLVDGGGLQCNFVGDNMGHLAQKQGLAAIVVNGGARDIAGYRVLGMPLYCTGPAVSHRPLHIEVVGRDLPVRIGPTIVHPNDILFADEDGLAVIPGGLVPAILDNLSVVQQVELELERVIGSGAAVSEIHELLGRKRMSRRA